MKVVENIVLASGARVTGLLTPTGDDQPATKGYVDGLGAGLTTEQVQDLVAAMILAGNNVDVTYNDAAGTFTIDVEGLTSADISDFAAAAVAAANAGVIDADTLGGSTKAQVISDAIAGVVDTAPATLDTLNELAAALGDDANFAATVNAALAARVQSFDATVGDGAATTYTVTHNLNTKKVIVQVYETATPFEEVWATVKRATVNTVTVSFATAPTAGQYTVVVQGRPGA